MTINCLTCTLPFLSRNALFRHLKETGCGGGEYSRTEHCLLLYGYDGSNFRGSQHNDLEQEAAFPTAEGQLIAAVERAAKGTGASFARCSVHSRSSRTDRGVHALANAVRLKVFTSPVSSPNCTAFHQSITRNHRNCIVPFGRVIAVAG